MELTPDLPLSLTGNNIWKGKNKSNGQLQLIHNYFLETGFSNMVIGAALAAELTAAGKSAVPFGNGMWYDRNLKSTMPNRVYAGVPVAAGAVPKFAGILKYDAALDSMQPAINGGVMPYNKGAIVKRGFVLYKTGKAAAAGAAVAYADVNDTMCMFVENSTGDPVFAVPTSFGPDLSAAADVAALRTAINAANLEDAWKPKLANCTYIGKIVMLMPEVEGWVVEINA